MQGLSSYVVTATSTIRVQAYTAEDAVSMVREIVRIDGPDEFQVERSESEPSDRDYS